MEKTNAGPAEDGARPLSTSLANRLQEIPGVAEVAVDLTESGGGINVRLEPGADEAQVMDRLRSLLVAYGVRTPSPPTLNPGRSERAPLKPTLAVEAEITPINGGARVEVSSKNVKSFRVVAAKPSAIAQGLSDAWCQVLGRVPVEVSRVEVDESGLMTVVVSKGEVESAGSARVDGGWEGALTKAVGTALQRAFADDDQPKVAVNS